MPKDIKSLKSNFFMCITSILCRMKANHPVSRLPAASAANCIITQQTTEHKFECGGGEKNMHINIRPVVIEDYDKIYELWNSTEQSRRALNPVDDSREGIERYLKRNPSTCFLAYTDEENETDQRVVGVILTGHDGRRAIVHHLCVHPDCRRQGIAHMLVQKAEEALRKEGIAKVFGLVFKDNDAANGFWEEQGYTLRTNLNYRNKSLNENVPQGE